MQDTPYRTRSNVDFNCRSASRNGKGAGGGLPTASGTPPQQRVNGVPQTIPGVSKGLKHFSIKVAEKVESKGLTNYSEVADSLIKDMQADAAAGWSIILCLQIDSSTS